MAALRLALLLVWVASTGGLTVGSSFPDVPEINASRPIRELLRPGMVGYDELVVLVRCIPVLAIVEQCWLGSCTRRGAARFKPPPV
jgi:hypothetical protein